MDREILFLLIFFVFAVLQGIGPKRKQDGKQRGQPPTGTGEGGAPGQGRERSQAASRERVEDARRDRVQTAPRSREGFPAASRERPEAAARERAGAASRPEQQPVRSSEGLIPGDIWEEIMGLARGGTAPAKPADEPAPSRKSPPESREGAVARKPSPASVLRRPSPPVAPVPSEPASAVISRSRKSVRTELFGGDSARDLRKAIVMKEVLGPPVSLKE
jgi:hypothetical protein